jgi:hypothetical protein
MPRMYSLRATHPRGPDPPSPHPFPTSSTTSHSPMILEPGRPPLEQIQCAHGSDRGRHHHILEGPHLLQHTTPRVSNHRPRVSLYRHTPNRTIIPPVVTMETTPLCHPVFFLPPSKPQPPMGSDDSPDTTSGTASPAPPGRRPRDPRNRTRGPRSAGPRRGESP